MTSDLRRWIIAAVTAVFIAALAWLPSAAQAGTAVDSDEGQVSAGESRSYTGGRFALDID